MKRKGTIWLTIGLLLVTAALCLTIYNILDDMRAEKTASEIMEKLLPSVMGDEEEIGLRPVQLPIVSDTEEIPEMPVKTIDGNEYIAVISLPTLGLELPVFSEWNYTKLSSAPCRFYGSVYTNDFVICAHNYRMHFGRISSLAIGDSVIIVDMDGNVFNYVVVGLETVGPNDVEEMISGDEWDLTLFTCTLEGSTRVTVRCALLV